MFAARRRSLVLVGLFVAMFALVAAGPASAKKPKLKILSANQGEILDNGKIPVSVKAKGKGKAKLDVSATAGPYTEGSKKAAKGKVKLKGKRKKVQLKLTAAGDTALRACETRVLRATVSFKPKGNKKQKAKSKKKTLELTWAPCSVGSENPSQRPYFGPEIPTPDADRCDFLDTSTCLYPFPNDYYTKADASTPTGKRLNIAQASSIKNLAGNPVDVTDINRGDGYSPGEPITLKLPAVDNQAEFNANGLVPVTDIRRYADGGQKVVVINADTGERHPVFAEVDATATTDADRILYIRPTVNFDEGGHYVVAIRGLLGADGGPGLAFRAYRDRLITEIPALENRRAHMETLFTELQGAGIQRANLDIAWDFTVASEESLSGRATEIRDDAFARLGDTNLANQVVQGDSPDFDITNVRDCTVAGPCGGSADARLLRIVEGTVNVPCYLDADGCPPGSKFAHDGSGEITWNPAFDADVPFTCVVPRSTDADTATGDPAKPSLYGHGLLGDRGEVENGSGGNIRTFTNDYNYTYCATNWAGFSEDDLGQIVLALGDMSNFVPIADRMQQGFVNFLYLGRAMIHPDGLGSNAAFQDTDGDSIINENRLFYDGNSQGGIMGGALTALSPDFDRAVLGVPGMNYSTLLQRSVDFDEYAEIPEFGLYDNYPNLLERPLVFSLVQMLWDRGEANGYAQHMTADPLPNTPAHNVLLHAAYGDHQVSNLTAEIEARTIGAKVMQPALDPGRHWEENPFFGLDPITSYPYTGSALVYFDGGPFEFTGTIGQGTKEAPITNEPPRTTDGYGGDPHSFVRRDAQAMAQKAAFLQIAGSLTSGCTGGDPCYSNGFTGAP